MPSQDAFSESSNPPTDPSLAHDSRPYRFYLSYPQEGAKSPPEGSTEHGHRVSNVGRQVTQCARRPAGHRVSLQLFGDFDGEKAVWFWLPPRDSTFPIESIDWRGFLVQYPVWYPENFGHPQTSMWLRPDHTNTQRIPAIADRDSICWWGHPPNHCERVKNSSDRGTQNPDRISGIEPYSGVPNVPRN